MFVPWWQMLIKPLVFCGLAQVMAMAPCVNSQVVDAFVQGEKLQQLVLLRVGTQRISAWAKGFEQTDVAVLHHARHAQPLANGAHGGLCIALGHVVDECSLCGFVRLSVKHSFQYVFLGHWNFQAQGGCSQPLSLDKFERLIELFDRCLPWVGCEDAFEIQPRVVVASEVLLYLFGCDGAGAFAPVVEGAQEFVRLLRLAQQAGLLLFGRCLEQIQQPVHHLRYGHVEAGLPVLLFKLRQIPEAPAGHALVHRLSQIPKSDAACQAGNIKVAQQ